MVPAVLVWALLGLLLNLAPLRLTALALIVAYGLYYGLVEAAGRVLGLLRDLRAVASADYLQSVMRSLWWRRLDGFALLFFTGLATMTIALRW